MPDWLCELIELNAHGGDWNRFLEAVYTRFCSDLVGRKAAFKGRPVAVRKQPPTDGKEFGFWHCISTGNVEDNRVPDLDRCSRIGWIRNVIDNADAPEVEIWTEQRGPHVEHLLWVGEEFLVVLSERGTTQGGGPDCYLLKTAYCTFREHEKKKKRAARDAARKANAASQGEAASNTPSTHGG